MPKAKAGVRYLDIGALLGGEHVVRTTEVMVKRPVVQPTGSTKRMRQRMDSADASDVSLATAVVEANLQCEAVKVGQA
jgi:hypothetical protein